jgi:hypothetical protein
MYSTDTATSRKPQLFSAVGRSRVHDGVRSLLIALVVAVAGCGRTALEPIPKSKVDAATKDAPLDLPADRMDAPRDMPMERPPPDTSPCLPKPEVCNGVDDDCDGDIDEDQTPIPCPNGGARYCVGGAFAECPRSCHVCVPGSKRTCITTFCTFWGSQSCAEDGRSFGACKETQAPEVCRDIANRMMRSPELEECCIKNRFCCVDEFDLDHDGDRTEMLGQCDAIICDP